MKLIAPLGEKLLIDQTFTKFLDSFPSVQTMDSKEATDDDSLKIWIGNIPNNVKIGQFMGALSGQGYQACNKLTLRESISNNKDVETTQWTILQVQDIATKNRAIKDGIKYGKEVSEQIELIVREYTPKSKKNLQHDDATILTPPPPPPPSTTQLDDSKEKEETQATKETSNDAVSGFKSELNALFGVIEGQMEFMQKQEKNVMKIIEESGDHSELLKSAKDKSTETEQELLGSILNMATMNEFLQNIILIENLFNSQYDAKQRSLQQNARKKFAPQIEKYEDMKKPLCNVDTFVGLLFYAKTDLSAFKKWIASIVEKCKEENIDIMESSGAKEKNIERAFYKSFYVYTGDDGKSDMGFQRMTDLLRASLVFDDWENMYRCFAVIEQMAKEFGGILRVKDRFNPQNMEFGYRDLLINVNCPKSKVPIVCEIQLHHKMFYKFKKISHSMYKKARIFQIGDKNLAYQYADEHIRAVVGDKTYEVEEEKEEDPNIASKNLLAEWNLSQYAEKLIDEEGWDDPAFWTDLKEEHLKEMGFKPGQINKFMKNVSEWNRNNKKKNKEKRQWKGKDKFKKKYKKDDEEDDDDGDLEGWMRKNNIYDKPLFSALVAHGVTSSEAIKALDREKFDQFVRNFRSKRFDQVKSKKKQCMIDKRLIDLEKCWRNKKKDGDGSPSGSPRGKRDKFKKKYKKKNGDHQSPRGSPPGSPRDKQGRFKNKGRRRKHKD